MKNFLIAIALIFPLAAQDIDSIHKDLKKAQSKLTKQRETIAVEKLTTGKIFEKTRANLLENRRKARIARMSQSDRSAMLSELKKKHHNSQQNHGYINTQLRDYRLHFDTFLLPGEGDNYHAKVDDSHILTESPALEIKSRLASLEAGITQLENLIGGSTFSGEAVAPDGEIKPGTFARSGPAIWFLSEDGGLSGAVVSEKTTRRARIIPSDSTEINTIITEGTASLGIDVTGGTALALTNLENNKLDILRKGGFWIWPILGIALFSAISGIVKLSQIIRIHTPEPDWISNILTAIRDKNQATAEKLANEANHPASAVISRCLGYINAGPDVVEEVLYEQLIGVQNKMQSWLPFIAITAATAPLLGLLGTVSGMIRTFNVITVSGTGDAKPLAGGISEALVTTLFGLIVAIPALIIHAMLSRRCQGIIQNTEKLGLTLVNGLRGKTKNPD